MGRFWTLLATTAVLLSVTGASLALALPYREGATPPVPQRSWDRMSGPGESSEIGPGGSDVGSLATPTGGGVPTSTGIAGVVTIPVGGTPAGGVYDPADGFVYVSNENLTDYNVTIFDGTQVVGSLPVGGFQQYPGVFDAQDAEVYVTSSSGMVSVLNGTSVVAKLAGHAFGGLPAYDAADGDVYVPAAFWVDVFHGTTRTASIPLPYGAWSATYDPADGDVYVTSSDYGTDSVAVLNGTRIVANLTVGEVKAVIEGAAFDPADGWVYLPNGNDSNVSLLGGATALGSVPVGAGPVQTVYDAADGDIYVANSESDTVSILNGTTVVATVPVPNEPWAEGYDPGDGAVYVSEAVASNISVLRGTTLIQRVPTGSGASLPLGSEPGPAVADPATGSVYVPDTASGEVSIIPPVVGDGYAVTFQETGLPAGTDWSVLVDGRPQNTTTSEVGLRLQNGSYDYRLGSVAGFPGSPATGTFTVDGSNVTIEVTYGTPATLVPVTFTETGLPPGTIWSVTLNGTTNSSNGPTIGFAERSGTPVAFSVAGVPGYAADPASGTLAVGGSPVGATIGFVPVPAPLAVSAWANVSSTGGGGLYCVGDTGAVGVHPAAETIAFAAVAVHGTPPFRYDWEFGDGSSNDSGPRVNHTYGSYGTRRANLTVTDAAGATNVTSWNLIFAAPNSTVPDCPRSAGVFGLPWAYAIGLAGAIALGAVGGVALARRRKRNRGPPPVP